MLRRRHITLLATILAFAAAIASGGGVARFVHMMGAHGGNACATQHLHVGHWGHVGHVGTAVCGLSKSSSRHGGSQCNVLTLDLNATLDPDRDSERRSHSTVPTDGCAVCAELAVNMPTPELASPFDLTIEVLAIVHEREAALQPTVVAPRVFAARPPPALL